MDVQIQGYPTIKFFVDGKPTDYDGPRTADGIVDYVLRKFRNVKIYLFRLLMRESEEAAKEDMVDTVTVEILEELMNAM